MWIHSSCEATSSCVCSSLHLPLTSPLIQWALIRPAETPPPQSDEWQLKGSMSSLIIIIQQQQLFTENTQHTSHYRHSFTRPERLNKSEPESLELKDKNWETTLDDTFERGNKTTTNTAVNQNQRINIHMEFPVMWIKRWWGYNGVFMSTYGSFTY